MDGQYTVWDIVGPERKPCEYSFPRYMGQKVRLSCGAVGKIVEIMPYYTYVHVEKNHTIMVGTPTTMAPMEDK